MRRPSGEYNFTPFLRGLMSQFSLASLHYYKWHNLTLWLMAFFWFIVCISSFPKKKLKNAQEEGYGCAWCLELTLTEHRSLGGVGWGRGGGRGKTTSLKRSGMLYIVYSLRKWTRVSQLNEQPKELKKNLEKFRLDRESNSDLCNNPRLV